MNSNNVNHSLFLGCGRVMGKTKSENDDDDKVYFVGGLFNLVKLTKKEFAIYLQSLHAKSLEEWFHLCVQNGLLTNAKELEVYENRFKKEYILIHHTIRGIDDAIFRKFTITKSGICLGYSKEAQSWIINSVGPKRNGFNMSSEEYDIWRSSSGICTIADTMRHFVKIRGCTAIEAFYILMKYINRFNKAGLWNIEYCEGNDDIYATENEIEITTKEECFDVHQLHTDSMILAVGEEFGEADGQFEIAVGNQKVVLEREEFLIWLLCRKNEISILKLNEIVEMEESQIKDIVIKLVAKKLVMIWPKEWRYDESFIISAVPQGTSIGMITNELYEAKDLIIGKEQILSIPMYFLWVFSHGFTPLGFIVQVLKKSLNIRQKEAELLVAKCIPVLLEKGLINLQVIPNNP